MSNEGSAEIHQTSSLTSFHRAYMLSLFNRTIKNSYSRPDMLHVVLAARHGPALGVIPVFIPSHPCHSILFVFYHFSHLLTIYPQTYSKQGQLQCLVATIYRNLLFFMAYMHNLATSSALERLLTLESPWGLDQNDRFSPIFLAFAFISCKYNPTVISSSRISLVMASQLQMHWRSTSPYLIIRSIAPPIWAI